jgi:lipopolysaccharide/colanic/teichoic acid biosynthesis glycosyltransferase
VAVPYPWAKKLLDKCLASALLIVFSPVFGVLWAAMGIAMVVRPADRGPWLYRELRVSRGREFELLKFRTLRHPAIERMGKERHARLLEHDPGNLTWAGKRLLKPWYLDELPQLVNILRGDMSLVGPRPWPPEMVREQLGSGLDYRLHVMAGWTGPAQLTKGVDDPVDGHELDLAYAETCRTWSAARLVRYDLNILKRTVGVLVRGEGLAN